MARRFDLELEPTARRELDALGVAIERRLVTRSLNRTIVGVRTQASRMIRAKLTLKAKRVNRDLSVHRARAGAKQASIQVAATKSPLIEFGARETRRGVSFGVHKGGGRKKLRHAFIATMRSGHKGVFTRELEGGHPVKRLGIQEHYSTAVVQFLDDDDVVHRLGVTAVDRFGRELNSGIQHELGKL